MRWADMDAQGHINNVQYLRYFEQSRIEYYGDTMVHPEWGQDIGMLIVHQSCDYHLETSYPGIVEIRLFLEKTGRSSVTMHQEMYRSGDEMIRAACKSVLVFVNTSTKASAPIPMTVHRMLYGK